MIAEHVELAGTFWKRMRGLMGREALPDRHALVIVPCSSIHMFFMRFPIDVLFLDEDNRVVRVVRGLAPWHICAARGSHKVVEMAAGSLDPQTVEGDELKLE